MANYYDCIIIGSGIAGLACAYFLPRQYKILVLSKGSLEECNTFYAQGGIASATLSQDSPLIHEKDTLNAGDGLCSKEAVRLLTKEGPKIIRELMQTGLKFDRDKKGNLDLHLEAAHTFPRVLHLNGINSGQELEKFFLLQIKNLPNIDTLPYSQVIKVKKEASFLVYWIEKQSKKVTFHSASHIILATGGNNRVYQKSSNPPLTRGNGILLALEMGLKLANLEFVQFHPTGLNITTDNLENRFFLLTESLRGAGATLVNKNKEPFMANYHPKAELASRDIVTRSIIWEMKKQNSSKIYLDATSIPREKWLTDFHPIFSFCKKHQLDVTKEFLPIVPIAHYQMGGIKTDLKGQTNMPNMYACGEVACSGVHGANRLASNSLLEGLVFSKIIAQTISSSSNYSKQPSSSFKNLPLESLDKEEEKNIYQAISLIKKTMQDKVCIIRKEKELLSALQILEAIKEKNKKSLTKINPLVFDFHSLITNAILITQSALKRKESRGSHYRSDFPRKNKKWEKEIIIT